MFNLIKNFQVEFNVMSFADADADADEDADIFDRSKTPKRIK